MTTKIKPNAAFTVTRPDEVAECWDGVFGFGNLYETLWGCVDHYDDKHMANIEDIGPHDVIGINAVALFWDRFTDEQKTKLNELAEAHDAEWKEYGL